MKIFLLEDELMLQSSIEEYLEDYGYIVKSCEDGLEALNLIKKDSFDLLILDINIPSLNGLELLEELQKLNIYTPTIYISALTQIDYIEKAYTLGCYDYLKKPFHLKELVLHIDKLLKIQNISPKSVVNLSKAYRFDLESKRLTFNHIEQTLTHKHINILELLTKEIDKTVTFDMLRYYIWRDDNIDNATIRAEMHRLKKALKEDLIESIKGVGYKLKSKV